jgi:hypothetical protein
MHADQLCDDGNSLTTDMYVSFKKGVGDCIANDGRHFTDLTPDELVALADSIEQLSVSAIWELQDRGVGRAELTWVNGLLRRAL